MPSQPSAGGCPAPGTQKKLSQDPLVRKRVRSLVDNTRSLGRVLCCTQGSALERQSATDLSHGLLKSYGFVNILASTIISIPANVNRELLILQDS